MTVPIWHIYYPLIPSIR